MAKEETNISKRIQKATSKLGARLFRQNVGGAWVGKVTRVSQTSVLIENARPIQMGLITGSSDLIGWYPVVITPEMVGRKVAVFTAMEVKTPHGIASPEQKNFVAVIEEAGGIAAITRSEESALELLANFVNIGAKD